MKFHGLFVGIDRYQSLKINELSCACRDARALHALFSDTLGGEPKLLTDEQATADALAREFETLSHAAKDDIVVLAFSGHGSERHELIAYDTDPANLKETAIHLDTLTEWFSRIPARRLILFLDCCFSGGMGAKVLHVDLKARDIRSTESVIEQLSGSGRLILTASSPTEPAYENAKIGHGLLTYYLLEALQGAEEVRKSGKIAIYRLLEYVTQRVIGAAGDLGEAQHPTLRGQLDGELVWPIFKPGALYSSTFPKRALPKITGDVRELAAYGFPDPVIEAWIRASITTLNELQIDAINEFKVLDGDHLVVSAPTSSGKTMIGEMAAIKGALHREKTLFLLPLKALVYDKQRQFTEIYGPFGIRTLDATSDTDDIAPLLRGQYDICLLTYEKFASVVLGSPHVLNQVSTVVIDEVQMIADESRGANLEFILTLLRMRRKQGVNPQIIALSAVIGDTNGLERWLDARLLRREKRPVPLDEGALLSDGSFRYIASDFEEEQLERNFIRPVWSGKQSSQDYVIPLVMRLVNEGKQVIVFREQTGETQGVANYLARDLGLPPVERALEALPSGDLSASSEALRGTLKGGVAFHNSHLSREERRVIEEEFRRHDSRLRVIAATTTLAMGVNTPASSVVIVGLTHPGPTPYTVAEYKNLAGRAGRLGYAERGSSFLIAKDGRSEHNYWHHYVLGKPEDLFSRFLSSETDPRTLIVKVLVGIQRYTPDGACADEIIEFLEASFGAFQQRQKLGNWQWSRDDLRTALEDIERHGLVEQIDGRIKITELGELAGEAGSQVRSVIRLVECLRSVPPNQLQGPTLITATQLTEELDDVYFPINKSSTRKEPAFWPSELRGQGIPENVIASLQWSASKSGQSALRAKKAVSCLLFMTDRPLGEIERIMTQFSRDSTAAGQIRSVADRTCDLLPTTVRVAEILNPDLDLAERRMKLLVRLQNGLPAAAAELARWTGRNLTRADYLRLTEVNLISPDALEKSCDESILECVSSDRQKLREIRKALKGMKERSEAEVVRPVLAPFEE